MANTFSILDYNSTFGDWLVATNALIRENNDLAANNYTKSSGTLFLNETGLSLQTANSAIIGGILQVQGIGSSAYIQNNLRVDGQVYFTNTVLGLVNSGQANIGGPLLALAPGNALRVSNNATIGGYATIGNYATVGGTISVVGDGTFQNNITVSGNVYSSNLTANNTVTTNTLVANNISIGSNVSVSNISVSSVLSASNADSYLKTVTTSGNVTVGNKLIVGGDFQINGTIIYNTNRLTINANNNVGDISYFGVNRGTSGANAQLRWYETGKYWDILDVDSGSTYYRVITENLISGSLTSTNSNTAASSAAANTLDTKIVSANTQLKSYVDGYISYNSGVNNSQNTRSSTVEANTIYLFGALNQTNTNIVSANTQLKSYVDGQITNTLNYSNGIDAAQNTRLSTVEANTIYLFGALNQTNTNIVSANTQLKSYADGIVTGGSANAYFNTIGVGSSPDTANVGSILATGQITAYYSDENLKNKLGNIENALEKVLSLNGFYYESNEIAQSLGYAVKREVGVSAQEVKKVLPEVIAPAPINNEYLTVHYERLIPLLIESIKELKVQMDELKNINK